MMKLAFSLILGLFLNFGSGLKVGDVAPDFSLKNVTGQMTSLADLKGANGFVIVFTCNHCPYAKKYEQRIIELHKKYAPQGYPVVAINPNDPSIEPDDSFEMMQKVAKEKKYPFLYLFDERQEVYPAYGATRTPHVFILDKDRRVQYIGAIDNNVNEPDKVSIRYIEDALESMKQGKAPNPANTRAIGCSIKAKKS